MTRRIPITLLLLGSLIAPTFSALAETAPWYKWQGATRVVCLQYASPKSALKLIDGPYRDSSCKYRGRPG